MDKERGAPGLACPLFDTISPSGERRPPDSPPLMHHEKHRTTIPPITPTPTASRLFYGNIVGTNPSFIGPQNIPSEISDIENYFISLSLPEQLKVWLAKARDAISDRFGDLVGRPMRPSKYHITLAVIRVSQQMDRTLYHKISIDLALKVENALNETYGDLLTPYVGRFGNGALYLEVEDKHGILSGLRKIIVEFCNDLGLEVFETSCFHITLFRENQVVSLPESLHRDYDCAPLSFGIGATRCVSDCGSRYLRPMVCEIYHGAVKQFDKKAASRLLPPNV